MVKGFLLEMQEWFNTHKSIHGLMSERKERMSGETCLPLLGMCSKSLQNFGNCNVIWDLQLSLVAQVVKTLPAVGSTWVCSLGREDPLEKGMANQSSILAWKIPWQRNLVSYTVHGATKSWTLYKFKVCELNRNLGNGLETQLSLKRLFLWEKYILPIPSRTHKIHTHTHTHTHTHIYVYHNPLILKTSCCYYYTDLCVHLPLCQLWVLHLIFD